ncbi:Uncharacterized protein FWK35_00006975 [Aphis craccivora]|uniref:Uncharacterized protein n=1 Tax=Aphis craccivora TaxID=307492 RepID=A0A6G0Z2X2_APHCR|nr:Uncharacterized protein FWK35_00006975 [Aphis craccivora]
MSVHVLMIKLRLPMSFCANGGMRLYYYYNRTRKGAFTILQALVELRIIYIYPINDTLYCSDFRFDCWVPNCFQYMNTHKLYILDSERSDECIDFTMIITSRNNAPISNFGSGFRCKSEYPWCIIEVKMSIKILDD